MTTTIAPTFSFSAHAKQRMADMALGPDDAHLIRDAMLNPRSVRAAGVGKEYRTRGRITLLVTTGPNPVVVSVLWARMSDWAEDEATIQSRGKQSTPDQHRRARRQIQSRKAHSHYSRRG